MVETFKKENYVMSTGHEVDYNNIFVEKFKEFFMDDFPRIFPDVPKADTVYFTVSIPKRSVVGVILGFSLAGAFNRVSPSHGNVVRAYHRV